MGTWFKGEGEMNTIVITVHNKEKTIVKILQGLVLTVSHYTKDFIVVLDGCTDSSNILVSKFIDSRIGSDEKWQVIYTDDVWETKANNAGLKSVETDYVTIVQDDMWIKESDWDAKLLKVIISNEVFAVSGRAAHNISIKEGNFHVVDSVGREYPLGSRTWQGKVVARVMRLLGLKFLYRYCNYTSIRLVANRGPLILRMSELRELEFLDERYAPFELDDIDLCCRAYKRFGKPSACCPIYYREIGGSKKTSSLSRIESLNAIRKNTVLLKTDHYDLFVDEGL